MVTIISKQEGPSKKEAELKHHLKQNRGTIEGMVTALKHGPMSHLAKQPTIEAPQSSGKSVFYKNTSSEGDAKPYVRVSLNGRVVLVDYETGSQLHHIGDVRGKGAAARFALATKANGFFAPVEPEIAEALKALDGRAVGDREAEEAFKTDVTTALGLA